MIALLLRRIRMVVTTLNLFIVGLLALLWLGMILSPPCSANKGSSSIDMEIKGAVGGMNHWQQVHYLEKGSFAESLDQLGMDIQPKTETSAYSVRATANATFQYGTTRPDCRVCRFSLHDLFPFFQREYHSGFCLQKIGCISRSYAGVVYTKMIADQLTTLTTLCRAKVPGTVRLNPTYRDGIVDCGSDAEEME